MTSVDRAFGVESFLGRVLVTMAEAGSKAEKGDLATEYTILASQVLPSAAPHVRVHFYSFSSRELSHREVHHISFSDPPAAAPVSVASCRCATYCHVFQFDLHCTYHVIVTSPNGLVLMHQQYVKEELVLRHMHVVEETRVATSSAESFETSLIFDHCS